MMRHRSRDYFTPTELLGFGVLLLAVCLGFAAAAVPGLQDVVARFLR